MIKIREQELILRVHIAQSPHEQPQQVCGEHSFRLPTSRGTWINCRESSRWSLPGNGEGGGAGLREPGFEDTEGQFGKHLQLPEGELQNLWSQILLRSSTQWAVALTVAVGPHAGHQEKHLH